MEESRNGTPSPPRLNKNVYRILTVVLFCLVGLLIIIYGGTKATSTSTFCSSCHEMKPEYYTWKASTHSEVDCVSCHIEPGAKNLVKAKADGVKELYKKVTNSYTAPIKMPSEIPNEACETCHNMDNRLVTPSEDIIIPHDTHAEKDVACIQCHSGVAHGKIAQRKVTFQTDYHKWDKELGRSMMSDSKFVNLEMQECMDCHKARKATLACEDCHASGMYPESHLEKDFKLGTHGAAARSDLQECHTCHSYMSDNKIEALEQKHAVTSFLTDDNKSEQIISVEEYSKTNTFCRDCHGEKPPSHNAQFYSNHGDLATKNKAECLTCHEEQNTGKDAVTNVTCGSCHQNKHKNKNYREHHPVPLQENQKVDRSCLTCHSEPTCSSCHVDIRMNP